MSASREKRARQADPTIGEKKRIAQEEQAASQRKTRLYAAIGAVVAVAAAALIVWDSGLFHKEEIGATINGVDYTVTETDYYYNITKNQFISSAQTYAQYGMDVGYDFSKTPAEQTFSTNEETGEITTYEDYFRDSAMNSMRTVVALNAAAEAEGLTLSDESKAALESQLRMLDQAALQYGSSREAVLKANYGPNMTEEVLKKHLTMTLLANQYALEYEESLEFSQSELDAYYEANKDDLDSYDYRYAFISGLPETKKDADGNTIEATDEEKAAALANAKKQAEALVAAVKAGADFDAIAKDYVAESSKEYYEEKDYTLRTDVVGSSLSSLYSEWMMAPSRKAGDISLFESGENGYAVVLYLDRYLSDSATVDVRHILVMPEGDTEEATEFTDEQWAAAETKAKDLLTQFTVGADKTAEAFGKLAEEHSEDGRNEDGSLYSPGGLYTNVYKGQMVQEFEDWIFDSSRKSGDTGLVKTDYGWHVMYFVQRNEKDWKLTAENALLTEAVTEWTDELVDAYGVM